MSLMTILLSFMLLLGTSLKAEDVFYYSCEENKTTINIIKTNDQCDKGICEMSSYCKTNKGELYVNHLCPSQANEKCPTMIECLDNSAISYKQDTKFVQPNNNSNSETSNGISK